MNSLQGASSSWNGQGQSSSESNRHYQRHTPHQIQLLERNFAANSHPDETQRNNIARELGITPLQVKFWFQNKRTSIKAVTGRNENSILRQENERIRYENQLLRGQLIGQLCANCGTKPCPEECRLLLQENLELQQEILKVHTFLQEKGVDPNAPLDPNALNPPLYEVNSNAPQDDDLQNQTPGPCVDSSFPPQYMSNVMAILGLQGVDPMALLDQNMFLPYTNAPLGGNLHNPTPEQTVDFSFPPQYIGMNSTTAQGGNEVNSTALHIGDFGNPSQEWNPTAVGGSNGVDPTSLFDPIDLLAYNVGESTPPYEGDAWNLIAPSYTTTETGERLNTEERVDTSMGEANLHEF